MEKMHLVFKWLKQFCNLVDNHDQQKSEVLYTFMHNKSYTYLLNVEPSNLVFLKTCDREFDETVITLTDQNYTPSVIEGKINLTLLINKQKWHVILQNQERENMPKDADFFHLQEKQPRNMEKN